MSDTTPPVAAASAVPVVKTFAEFLESAPPDKEEVVTGMVAFTTSAKYVLQTPEISLHCENERCNGVRVFTYRSNLVYLFTDHEYEFLTYVCRNCDKIQKTFALLVVKSSNKVRKLGEDPRFGLPIPARLISLLGSDRELFLKGRRAELRGLGIGAFAYYRRVVEDKKGAIIEEIGKVAAKVKPSKQTADLFEKARTEKQFGTAIDLIKAAIPEALLIDGHNPLTLLHSALSEGLHAQTDEQCL